MLKVGKDSQVYWSLTKTESFELGVLRELKKLPSTIFALASLQILHLNICSKLENVFGFQTSWQKVGFLSQQRCFAKNLAISSSPRSMQLLCNLTDLKLVGCNLSHVPEAIGNLVTLESLQLSRNNFRSLPHTITSLHGLSALYLLHCYKLQSLPALPSNLSYVGANGCISLEEITPGSELNALMSGSFYGCHKKLESCSFLLLLQDKLIRYPVMQSQLIYSTYTTIHPYLNYYFLRYKILFLVMQTVTGNV